ncbi:MAG: methyl-accepting chemotaxis protein [Melioribacteraceae bacterium]
MFLKTLSEKLKYNLTKSLSIKFILSIILTLAIVSAAMLIAESEMLSNYITEIQKQKVERIGKLVSAASENAILSYDIELLERFSNEIRKDIDVVDIIFLDQIGSRLNSEKNKDSLTAAERKYTTDAIVNSEMKEYKFPIISGGNSIGNLIITSHSLEILDKVNSLLKNVSFVFGLGVLLLIVIMWLTSKKIIIKPLKEIEIIAKEVACGNVELEMKTSRVDEIGSLQNRFSEMVASIKNQSIAAEKIAGGNLEVTIPLRSEKDILSKSLNKVIESLKCLVKEVKMLSEAGVQGNLNIRGNSSKFEGGYKNIICGVNSTLDSVINPIKEGAKVLSKMAAKDFTASVSGDYQGDHKIIVESINEVAKALNKAFSEINLTVNETFTATNQISSSAEEMAAGAQEHSSQISDVATAVEQMTVTISETSAHIVKTNEVAKESKEFANNGQIIINNTIKGMEKIESVVKEASTIISELGSSSIQIGQIIQVINDIADQTNLLALNAAIEAARAGDHGRGFAVVADEVRKLAERTTKATEEIEEMIKKIQFDSENAVNAIKKGNEEVSNGMQSVISAGESMKEIVVSSDKVLEISTQVASASEEQSITVQQISKNIDAINSVLQESALGVQLVAKATNDLNNLTDRLQVMTSEFKLSFKDEDLIKVQKSKKEFFEKAY